MSNKIVLAFSGGLDTSYCVLDLVQQGYEVHTAFVDTGGVGLDGRDAIRRRALELGAHEHHEIDAGQEIWDEFVVPLVWSHARMLGEYPLLCSDRYLIVKRCLELCDGLGTRHFAHGCTGMGNDQLRFDQTVRSLGDYEILAPIRDLQSRVQAVRDHELKVMADAGVEVSASASRYSINENLLGVTISGSEIDRFQWRVVNVPGVQSTISMPQVVKRVNAGWNEGNLQWRVLPRKSITMVQSVTPIETSTGLLNGDCSAMPVMIFTEDHKAGTINRVVAAIEEFAEKNDSERHRFRLATGNVGVMAATNEAVSAAQFPMLMWVFAAIILLCLVTFRSIRGTLCIVIPLALVSILAYALMAILDVLEDRGVDVPLLVSVTIVDKSGRTLSG